MVSDYDVRALEDKIRSLERKIDDVDFELRQAKRELQNEIYHKADVEHSHSG